MKVELHVGRLVVHGAAGFDREAFVAALEDEIAARLAPESDASAAARRFEAGRAAGDRTMDAAGTSSVAGAVAARLLP